MVRLAFCVAALLAAFPWFFGGASYAAQAIFIIPVGLVAAMIWLQRALLLSGDEHGFDIPVGILPLAALLALGAVQLGLEKPDAYSTMTRATLASEVAGKPVEARPFTLQTVLQTKPSGSIDPRSTQLRLAQVAMLILVFLVARELFSSPETHRSLLVLLTLSGIGLSIVGVAQMLTGSKMLLWLAEPRYGSSPFASFVNRNTAAGFLCICLGANLGLLLNRDSYVSAAPFRSILANPAKLAGMLSAILIAGGVLMTASRAGLIAMCIAFGLTLFLLPVKSGKAWKVAFGVFVILIGGFALAKFTGLDQRAWDRLSTLLRPEAAFEGRWKHWSDSSAIVQDFPLIGTGLGSYRFANEPYQRHQSEFWYLNADNQYLESAVEGGFIGLAIFIAMLVLPWFGSIVAMREDEHVSARPVATALFFSLICVGIMSTVHFLALNPAVAATLAALAGALAGGCKEILKPSSWIVLHRSPNAVLSISVGAVAIVVAGFGAVQLGLAAPFDMLARQIPATLTRKNAPPEITDQLITEMRALQPWHLRDGEYYAELAKLEYHALRMKLYDDFAAVPELASTRINERILWSHTHLRALRDLVRDASKANGDETIQEALASSPLKTELQALKRLLRRSANLNPFLSYPRRQLAGIAGITGSIDDDVSNLLVQSLWASPRSAANTIAVAIDAADLQLHELNLHAAIRRALAICESCNEALPEPVRQFSADATETPESMQ